MKLVKRVFVFSEEIPKLSLEAQHPTMIHQGYMVMIPGEEIEINGKAVGKRFDRYYRVLDENIRANTHRPQPFMLRKSDKSIRGWRFEVLEITNEETIKALRERKIACLVLNPKCVEEKKENQTK